MRLEIERKFLVAHDGWRDTAMTVRPLKDGLIGQFARGKVRVRLDGERAWLTVKGARDGLARPEFEYQIPFADGTIMLDQICADCVIEKLRYCVPHEELTWEVDVFQGALSGLILAEIELGYEAQSFGKPDWLGEEITGDPRFCQSALLRLGRAVDRSITIADVIRPPAAA